MADVDAARAEQRAAAVRLRAAGITAAGREASRIWSDLGGAQMGLLWRGADPAIETSLPERFRLAVEQRAAGTPLQYVTGTAGFRHLDLRSDRRALIPRPETEGLVDLVLARVRSGQVADIGTGSGCIALSLAQEGAYATVIAVDRSSSALALARENATRTGLPVRFIRSDLASALGGGMLDALVSNPPYLTSAEYVELDQSVRCWEPGDALDAGPDGMHAINPLLDDGRRVVRPGGLLALEIDARRAPESARRATALGWESVSVCADIFGRDRYLLARRSIAP